MTSLRPSNPLNSPTRPLKLRSSSPFENPFDTPLDSPTRSKLYPITLSTGLTGTARIADRRGVNLVQHLRLAPVEYTPRGGGRRVRESKVNAEAESSTPSPDDTSVILAILGDSLGMTPITMTSASLSFDPPGTASTPSSGALPPIDESFMRWSRTASIFSDATAPSTFYYNGRTVSQISNNSPMTAPISASETSYPPSSFPEPMSHPPTSTPLRPDPKRRESANSSGTFGNRQRRWSAHQSSFSGGVVIDDFSPSESTGTTPLDEDVQFGSTSSRPLAQQRRPLSMSSASDSAFSGLVNGATIDAAERVRVGRSNISGATFPSPTLRRPVHNAPESAADITAHLLKASGKNESRIVPRLSPAKPGPTVGTPIASEVREEGWRDDEDEPRERRTTSKLDQILGEGAETARVLMEFDRRDRKAVKEVVELLGMTSLPPPPPRKPSTGPSTSSIPILPPATPPSPQRHTHGRNNSIDSLSSSLHHSIGDSTHTTTRLLTSQSSHSPPPLPRQPTETELAKLLAKPELHNDLSVEQRSILVKRTRKIEQMLGEPLGEHTVSQHVVRPSTATSVQHATHDELWPTSSTASRIRIPEYDRRDCEPRTVRAEDAPPLPMKRGNSNLAMKAMKALGLVDKNEDGEDLRVYVTREMTVSEVVQRVHSTAQPASPTSDEPQSPVERTSGDGDDASHRARRMQAAKLHRLLGESVPPSALQSTQAESSRTLSSDTITRPPTTPQRSRSANSLSFMSFDEDTPPPSWAKRMRSAVVASVKPRDGDRVREMGSSFWDGSINNNKDKGKSASPLFTGSIWPPPPRDQSFGNRDVMDSSFMDMGSGKSGSPAPGTGQGGSLRVQRGQAKQARKLRQKQWGMRD